MRTSEFLEANKIMIIIFKNAKVTGIVNVRKEIVNQNVSKSRLELRKNKEMNVSKSRC